MKMIFKNTEKDKKKIKKDTIYNVSKIIKYCSIKYIKCFKIYQHVITTCLCTQSWPTCRILLQRIKQF